MGDAGVIFDRYGRIDGTDVQALHDAHVMLVGAGGIGGEVAYGLVRKGVGYVTISDFDRVDETNLHRQFFFSRDVGRNKAEALSYNLVPHATSKTEITPLALSFQKAFEKNLIPQASVMVVGVDNNETRIAASSYCLAYQIPAVFIAVDQKAEKGYVFVQECTPDAPCFSCFMPDAMYDDRVFGCAGSSIEILKAVAGIALYAIDSLLMDRPRSWSVKDIFFNQPDSARRIAKNPDCAVCSVS